MRKMRGGRGKQEWLKDHGVELLSATEPQQASFPGFKKQEVGSSGELGSTLAAFTFLLPSEVKCIKKHAGAGK